MTDTYRKCSIEGCDGNASAPGCAKGLCTKHYLRLRRNGDPNKVLADRGGPKRLIEQVLASSSDHCILWPFSRDGHGYAQVWHEGRLQLAHRVVCRLSHGEPTAPGMDCAHSCGNGHLGCINPAHLRWDTRAGNFADKIEHGTLAQGEDHVSAKLTDDDVREIKSLLGRIPQKEIAAAFKVSPPTISAIATGKRWGHVQ